MVGFKIAVDGVLAIIIFKKGTITNVTPVFDDNLEKVATIRLSNKKVVIQNTSNYWFPIEVDIEPFETYGIQAYVYVESDTSMNFLLPTPSHPPVDQRLHVLGKSEALFVYDQDINYTYRLNVDNLTLSLNNLNNPGIDLNKVDNITQNDKQTITDILSMI